MMMKYINWDVYFGKLPKKEKGNVMSDYDLKHTDCAENEVSDTLLEVPKKEISNATLRELSGKSPRDLYLAADVDENSIPIDLSKILNHFKIPTIAFDFSEMEKEEDMKKMVMEKGNIVGAVITAPDDDGVAIFFRKGDKENRRRFTVAHELAHCCLHAHELELGSIEFRRDIDSSLNPREIDVNSFAGELLIPEGPLMQLCNILGTPVLSVLAKAFQVSSNVMRARLMSLKMDNFVDDGTEAKG